jgi:hypothetical protein
MRYNQKRQNNVTNYEGAKAYSMNEEMELYSLVVNCMMSDQYYRKEPEILDKLTELVEKCDASFIQKLGVYAREEMHLRSIPLVLAVLMAKYKKLNSKYVYRIVQRADELLEILALYKNINGSLKPIPNSIKRGMAKAFNKFDEYQFAKYFGKKKKLNIKDVMNLVRPKPIGKDREELYKRIENKTLKKPYTWEVELSKAGVDKGKVWCELIKSNKLGYMALLRNLRNILENVNDKDVIEKVINDLSDGDNVLKSKQLPFRFLSAYLELQNNDSVYTSKILEALDEAVKHSNRNLNFDNESTVLIASDVSGSMDQNLTEKSKIELWQIGILLSMILQRKCKYCITSIFATDFKIFNFPKNNILPNVLRLQDYSCVGGSTNGWKVLDWCIINNRKFDKIMIFTDCEMWDSSNYAHNEITFIDKWYEYKKICKNVKLYLFNLAGYNTTPIRINEKDVFMISGFSESIFDMLNAVENKEKVLDKIKEIEL